MQQPRDANSEPSESRGRVQTMLGLDIGGEGTFRHGRGLKKTGPAGHGKGTRRKGPGEDGPVVVAGLGGWKGTKCGVDTPAEGGGPPGPKEERCPESALQPHKTSLPELTTLYIG